VTSLNHDRIYLANHNGYIPSGLEINAGKAADWAGFAGNLVKAFGRLLEWRASLGVNIFHHCCEEGGVIHQKSFSRGISLFIGHLRFPS
jgi:hypothetical protein